jgi:hypothetical protein
MASQKITVIGHWRSLYEPILPDPAWFVDEQWSFQERQRVTNYLRKGQMLLVAAGFSWCRFRCGTKDHLMGSGELTDGTYLWPEGLSHYIEQHGVRLPNQIIQHILAQEKLPHEIELGPFFENGAPIYEFDTEWWESQQGLHPSASSFISGSDEEERSYLRNYNRNEITFHDFSKTAHQAREQLAPSLRKKYH